MKFTVLFNFFYNFITKHQKKQFMIIKNRNLEEFEYQMLLTVDKHIYYEINVHTIDYKDICGIDNFIFFITKRKPFGYEITSKFIANTIDIFYEILKDIKLHCNEKLCVIPSASFNNKSIEELFRQIKIGHFLKNIN